MTIHYWPEGHCPDVPFVEKRDGYNARLRQKIDDIMLFLTPPQQMTVAQVREALRDVMAPAHVIERLTRGIHDAPMPYR